MSRKRNLEGYKQHGKRFIPPMKQLPMVREQSYINDMLPELIWLGLIHDHRGYRFGSRTLEAIVEITKRWPKADANSNFALQTAYVSLTDDQKAELVSELDDAALLDEVRLAVAPLVLLYEGCAISFLGPPSSVVAADILTQRLSDCVAKHMDKYETPAIVLHGSMLLTRLIAGTIKISSQIDLPDLNAVVDRPESADAMRAASFMRAHALGEFGMLAVSTTWAKHFWDRGAELAVCKLPDYVRDE